MENALKKGLTKKGAKSELHENQRWFRFYGRIIHTLHICKGLLELFETFEKLRNLEFVDF